MKMSAFISAIAWSLMALPATAGNLTYDDPTGDDFGPGNYTYPTDSVYLRGSFDIKRLEVKNKGSKVEFRLTLQSESKILGQPGLAREGQWLFYPNGAGLPGHHSWQRSYSNASRYQRTILKR